MKIDANPLEVAEANYTEPEEVNMVELVEESDSSSDSVNTNEALGRNATVVEVTEDLTKDFVFIREVEEMGGYQLEHLICMAAEHYFKTSSEVQRFDAETTVGIYDEAEASKL